MRSAIPQPYTASVDSVISARSVPVSVIVLTLNEDVNIARCLSTLEWAEQVVVVDSGSGDKTIEIARKAGATVVETHWRGFGLQRAYAMQLPEITHDWVYFVDADEWVSESLASELAQVLENPQHSAYWQYFRLVFQGRWIAHAGWYPSARIVRLMNRRLCTYPEDAFSEHPVISGSMGRLANDIVDEDLKGLASWLHKHVRYAELEAARRLSRGRIATRLPHESRMRHVLKDKIAPRLPARPLFTFVYMYVLRAGFRDGRQGLLFCLMHAWFQTSVSALMREQRRTQHVVTAEPTAGHIAGSDESPGVTP